MMSKCKYSKYNTHNYEHICTVRECWCSGKKTEQKDCLIAQLENKCAKYEQVLEKIENYFKSQDTTKTSLFNIFCIESEIKDIIRLVRGNNVSTKKGE